ncbi:MAG: hypothetical protein FD126_571 [Elusimicrobia bacterium]|nr:MAG: hypothetical protein FD126_571 [Elusimicrobiota bacterium]
MRTKTEAPARAYVWARKGRTAWLVDAKLVERAAARLPERIRVRLIARLRANTAEAALT